MAAHKRRRKRRVRQRKGRDKGTMRREGWRRETKRMADDC